ncbi:CSMD1 [Branchiostoma lanceolatum]|uniref:CSMD1 protein n=1 Tax=Branchiostoma lanceolatum TaxID=7740 RepID=A0A8K0EFL6_BRALA|nr:CSMD1 [Branchiostoma lanceolatum]
MHPPNSYGDEVTFTCDPGYKLVGTSSLTCLSDGTWNGRQPTCRVVQCPTLTPPVNGNMRGSRSYQEVMYFSCDRGYNLVGARSTKCQTDGTWSGSVPTCQAVRCTMLTPPANGAMTGSNSYRDVATFTCDPGYKLVGTSSLTCFSDGTWNGRSPTCTAVQCATPKPPDNGYTRGQKSYQEVMYFFCDRGYNLVGAKSIRCRADGSWSGRVPTCKAECRNGYQLLAQTCIRVHLNGKTYNDAQAACESEGAVLAMPKTIELDVALRNQIIKSGKDSNYWIGLTKWQTEWEWADRSKLNENPHKGWNPGTELTPPVSSVDQEDTGTHLYHYIDKDEISKLRQTGKESKQDGQPTLSTTKKEPRQMAQSGPNKARRPLPPIPSQDVTTGDEPKAGSVDSTDSQDDPDTSDSHVYNYADKDYINNLGQQPADTGTDDSLPKTTNCNIPGLLDDGMYIPGALRQDTNDTANSCGFSTRCKMAFHRPHVYIIIAIVVVAFLGTGAGIIERLIATPGRQADIHTAASGNQHVSTIAQSSNNARVHADNYSSSDNHTATGDNHTATDDNYTVTDDNYAATGDIHTATNDIHTATDDKHTATDDNPAATANGAVTGSNSYRDVATFSCDPGYKLVGTSSLTCFSAGTWSGGSPTCTAVWCVRLTPPAHGAVVGSNSYRDVATFTCDPGYKLVGTSSLTCQSDGTLSGGAPTCKVVQCTKLTPPSHGAVAGSNSYRDVVTFTCDPGYKLVGTSSLTCQSDGTWSEGSPTCTAECRNGYQLLAQTCIRVHLNGKSYNDAQAACESEGAVLAMPKTIELDVALRNQILKHGIQVSRSHHGTEFTPPATSRDPEYAGTHMYHYIDKDEISKLLQAGKQHKHEEQPSRVGADSLPVTVGKKVVGLVHNGTYAAGALQQEDSTVSSPTENEPRQMAQNGPNKARRPLPSLPSQDVPTGTEFTGPATSGDPEYAGTHMYHYVDKDEISKLRQTGKQRKHEEQPSRVGADSLPVTVGQKVVGLVHNGTYTAGALQQEDSAGIHHQPDTSGSHMNNYVDKDDIKNLRQPPANTGTDSTAPNTTDCNIHGLVDNQMYIPGALRQGDNYTTTGDNYTATGDDHTATCNNYTAQGDNHTATGDNHTATGYSNTATGDNYTATGDDHTATCNNYTAPGDNHTATGDNHTATGYSNTATGDDYTATGDNYTTTGDNYTATGDDHTATCNNYTVQGDNYTATGDNHTATGYSNTATGDNYTAPVDNYTATGDSNTATCDNYTAPGDNHTATGHSYVARGDN